MLLIVAHPKKLITYIESNLINLKNMDGDSFSNWNDL